MLPKDSSSSSSSDSAVEGTLTLWDGGSVAADPHNRSAGNDCEDAGGCCSDAEGLWMSRPTRSIKISDWFVLPVPIRYSI